MNHDHDTDRADVDWVEGQEPQRIRAEPSLISDPFARQRAHQALIRHRNAGQGRRSGRRRVLRARALAVAGAGGVVAFLAVALLSSSGGDVHGPRVVDQGSAPAVSGAGHVPPGPLMKLADFVGESPAPSGNATVVRRTIRRGGTNRPETETKFDLYGDGGRYAYSTTRKGLDAGIEGRPDAAGKYGPVFGDEEEEGTLARELAAAAGANSGDIQAAAERMASAPRPSEPLGPGDGIYANRVWEWSLQAIEAGAGDPAIRAGALKILSTLPAVTITEASSGDGPILTLTSGPAENPDGTDRLTIDAVTGVPIRFVSFVPGSPPETTVEYRVSRAYYPELSSHGVPDE